jgi:hypothetical protein
MSPGASLPAGTNQLLVLQLAASTNASGLAALALDNSVATLQVADKTAKCAGSELCERRGDIAAATDADHRSYGCGSATDLGGFNGNLPSAIRRQSAWSLDQCVNGDCHQRCERHGDGDGHQPATVFPAGRAIDKLRSVAGSRTPAPLVRGFFCNGLPAVS